MKIARLCGMTDCSQVRSQQHRESNVRLQQALLRQSSRLAFRRPAAPSAHPEYRTQPR